MTKFIGAQTALEPAQKLLKELETKLPKDIDKDEILSMAEKWLCASGNFLAMFEDLKICDELLKEVLSKRNKLWKKWVMFCLCALY